MHTTKPGKEMKIGQKNHQIKDNGNKPQHFENPVIHPIYPNTYENGISRTNTEKPPHP